jgi:hypothetical protein
MPALRPLARANGDGQDRLLDDVLAETLGQIDRLELVMGKICQVRKIPLSQTAKRITHGSLGWTGLGF